MTIPNPLRYAYQAFAHLYLLAAPLFVAVTAATSDAVEGFAAVAALGLLLVFVGTGLYSASPTTWAFLGAGAILAGATYTALPLLAKAYELVTAFLTVALAVVLLRLRARATKREAGRGL